jgi:hypothetical protein
MTMELVDTADRTLILDTDRQAAAAWSYLLGACWPPSPELRAMLDRAEAFARRSYPTPVDVSDTDETCAECGHSVEADQHLEGCSSCGCSLALVPAMTVTIADWPDVTD